MQVLNLASYRSTINEIGLQKTGSKCSSDCYFRYDYPSSSTSFHVCIDNSSNNIIKIPNISVTNQTFTESTQPPPILFGNTKYWFDTMYITNSTDYLFKYNNDFGLGNGDIAMCSCMLLHKDEYSKNYLIVYIPIIEKQTLVQQLAGSAGEIIKKIVTDVSAGDVCSPSSLGTLISSPINLNNLIVSQKYYWTNDNNINFVIYSGVDPIYISSDTMAKINKYLPSTSSVSHTTSLSSIVTKVFTSGSAPINSLSAAEDEIYIKCRPTDEEGELLDMNVPKVPLTDGSPFGDAFSNFQTAEFFKNNAVVSVIFGIILMIVLIKGAEYLFKIGSRSFLDNL